ncbi:hypothetical protein HPP92_010652 [Vanilla planifolia]|uniref:Tesmin/TSO1-like CXC domain-containing protein n=1 Tax=Vanilla planifolia TaxID=51239 RepID=A0A835RA19_VANPL|nr:hypothetical protein HPP92_010652 [Vanilla planifolia]
MNHLFNLASYSRCQLREKEVSCREKDALISDLKEKIYKLNGLVRQLEAQKAASHVNAERLVSMKNSNESAKHSSDTLFANSKDSLDSRKARQKSSIFFNYGKEGSEIVADMDTSESEDMSDNEPEDSDVEWVQSRKITRKRRSRGKKLEIENQYNIIVEANTCCSCSRYSSCKTKKCECRVGGNSYGTHCSCNSLRCANRGDSCASLDDEKSREFISHGALLLQGALSEKSNLEDCNSEKRKPLSDIGNALPNTNTAKQKKRKNWRKSTIQIVPAEPKELPSAPQPQLKPKIGMSFRLGFHGLWSTCHWRASRPSVTETPSQVKNL